jgi:hypothetical protein
MIERAIANGLMIVGAVAVIGLFIAIKIIEARIIKETRPDLASIVTGAVAYGLSAAYAYTGIGIGFLVFIAGLAIRIGLAMHF